MDQIYIEALNEAKTLSDSDYLLIETSTEDLKISIETLKQLLSVATANKLTNPFELTLSGDAAGTATIDGSESVDIDVSQIKATSLKNDIKINGTPFDGQDGIVTDQWGKERQITIGGCSRSVNGESDIEFPANEVFSGSGQPYVPTAGGAMTGDLKRNINDADYTVYSATTETTESGTSVNIEFGDVNANPFILGLSQPIWNNGVNVKKLLTEDDIYELERRINELESMDTQTFKNPYKNKTIVAFGDNASTAVDHTELTSLSLDGNCYFDTEILPDENTNTKAKWNLQSGTTYIAGAIDDNYKFGYTCTDNFYAVRGTVNSSPKPASYWNGDWIINQTGVSYQFGDTTVDTDVIDSFEISSPYYLGNMSKNSAPAGTGVVGKIYYAQIYSVDTLVADMIPVKKSDGTLCLYDKVRKKYVYNDGTGTVTE